MKTLGCDICRHIIENPEKERNYYHIVNIDICELCRDELEQSIKSTVRNKTPFSYQWYHDLIVTKMNDGVQKGKIR